MLKLCIAWFMNGRNKLAPFLLLNGHSFKLSVMDLFQWWSICSWLVLWKWTLGYLYIFSSSIARWVQGRSSYVILVWGLLWDPPSSWWPYGHLDFVFPAFGYVYFVTAEELHILVDGYSCAWWFLQMDHSGVLAVHYGLRLRRRTIVSQEGVFTAVLP